MSGFDNPFDSGRVLLERARENTHELDAVIKMFLQEHQWRFVQEIDPQNGDIYWRFYFDAALPARASAIAYDIANNLRSVLDHVAFASAVVLTGDSEPKGTKFPFGDEASDLDNNIKRGCRGLHPDIIDLIRTFKPYQTGNGLLWALNKLRNTKSHKVLIPGGMQSGGVGFGNGIIRHAHFRWIGSRWDGDKDILTVACLAPGSDINMHLSFKLFVSLAGAHALSGGPAIDAFNRVTGEVEGVLVAIEAETARLVRERDG